MNFYSCSMANEILENILNNFAGDVDTDALQHCVYEKIPINADQ